MTASCVPAQLASSRAQVHLDRDDAQHLAASSPGASKELEGTDVALERG
jgi:hypothetical protein